MLPVKGPTWPIFTVVSASFFEHPITNAATATATRDFIGTPVMIDSIEVSGENSSP
jgi:hypothetical protein